jgi:hypothetical protein
MTDRDEFYGRLSRLAAQKTRIRLISDPEEAKRLGRQVGDQIQEYIRPTIKSDT